MSDSDADARDERDAFFEMSSDLLGVARLDGYFQRLNPAWAATLGWTSEELCASPWLTFVHPDDRGATVGAGAALARGAPVANFANRYRCRDGSFCWLEWQCVPSVQRGLIYAVARDVTAQRRAQEALRGLTESLETTLYSIGDGVIATDAGGAVLRMNPVAERLTGWALGDARGRALTDVFRVVLAGSRAAVESPVVRALREGVVVGLASHSVLVRPDGTEVPVADTCAPIRDALGRVSGAVLVFRDTSAELRARDAEERVQRRLIVAERMASVGTLAAGVAHEINNPLSYVTANLELVLEEIRALGGGSSSGRMRELEEMVLDAQQGADRVRKIVRGLKTFSRADAERRAVVDLRDVLELSINMAFNEIRHRAQLVKEYGPTPRVDADEARLGQVL